MIKYIAVICFKVKNSKNTVLIKYYAKLELDLFNLLLFTKKKIKNVCGISIIVLSWLICCVLFKIK